MENSPIGCDLKALLYHGVYVRDINEQGEIEYCSLKKVLKGRAGGP